MAGIAPLGTGPLQATLPLRFCGSQELKPAVSLMRIAAFEASPDSAFGDTPRCIKRETAGPSQPSALQGYAAAPVLLSQELPFRRPDAKTLSQS